MTRKVFFSFHYGNDVVRANVVRNSWITKPDRQTAGYIDHADFEKIKQRGPQAVKDWIDDQLIGSSVTIVLIGAETLQRPFVKYELEKSYKRGNAILGIYINNIRDFSGSTTSKSNIHGLEIGKDVNGSVVYFSRLPIYDWTDDNGYYNIGSWVENAINNRH